MKKVLDELNKNKDNNYKLYISKLIPNINRNVILGVRIPELRIISKKLNQNDYINFLNELPHKYLEENILHSIILSSIKDVNDLVIKLDNFLPVVDNWCVCDVLNPKILKNDLNTTYKYIKLCIKSEYPYKIRFGITMLMRYYLDNNFIDEYNELIIKIKNDNYYVNMAIAWYFSTALIKQYDKTIKIFENKRLNKWLHNKSIQKAIESYRLSNDKKNYLKTLKY